LKKADMYANKMHMSKAAVYKQLISEYGEKFTEDAAKYAIENVKVDWKENALYKADMYANKMHMSKAAVRPHPLFYFTISFIFLQSP